MNRQLFGTDGIRGAAGESPLDPPTIFAFGAALGEWAAAAAPSDYTGRARVMIGMDTRESGLWIAETVAAGLEMAGATPCFAGVTTTPAIAHLTRTLDFAAGVMISASHNPYHDNGLKAFGHSGFKLPDAEEHRIEESIFSLLESGVHHRRTQLVPDPALDRQYVAFLASTFDGTLNGLRLVLDCANGSASTVGPELFRALGAEVIATGCAPDGRNINLHCGSLHVEGLRRRVIEEAAGAGAAFDGDADRSILVGPSGKIIDGDHVLLIAARMIRPPAVVATVMSNLGLERVLETEGIGLIRTPVGDRYVLEEMLRAGLPLGGEQSGHVIFRRHSTTGDGLLTTLRALEACRLTGLTLDELTADLAIHPQLLVNVRFREKRPLEELASVQEEIRATEEEFGPAGRVLVRFSGTEPLARVMVEGPSLDRVEYRAHSIAARIKEELGG